MTLSRPESPARSGDLPDDVVLSVRGVSKKFCRNLRRSMWYGVQDLTRNLLGLRDGRSSFPVPGSSLLGEPGTKNQAPSTRNQEPRTKNNDPQLRRDEFWALQDISFDLKRGECLGLVGRNGSGKSTLLRLLAGIYPPDAGEIAVRGRVGALIALGAGFHPHMTGRENIYLNGTILGMTRRELDEKFADIVAFAEIGDFLDAPVSTYSSGMGIRLGFSIAAHLQPEILVVDEVLSVGDMAFQRKCLQHMERIRQQGMAIIFVSHNMPTMQGLCTTGLWIDRGHIRRTGTIAEVIAGYMDESNAAVKALRSLHYDGTRWGTGEVAIQSVELVDRNGETADFVPFQGTLTVRVQYIRHKVVPPVTLRVWIADALTGIPVSLIDARQGDPDFSLDQAGTVEFTFSPLLLRARKYTVSAVIVGNDNLVPYDRWSETSEFCIATNADALQGGAFHGQEDLVALPCAITHRPRCA